MNAPKFDQKEAAAVLRRRAAAQDTVAPMPGRQQLRRILAAAPGAALPGLAMGGVPAAGGQVERIDKDANGQWVKLAQMFVQTADPEEKEKSKVLASQAIGMLLSIREGIDLVGELARLFARRKEKPLRIHFVDKLPDGDIEGAGGYFDPPDKNAAVYDVYIRNERQTGGMYRQWPPGATQKDPRILSSSTGPVSGMARTLHHELLHIWFLNTQSGVEHESGHGDVDKGEIEPLFWNRLKSFGEQQDDFTRPFREHGRNP
jgi:hypothetical protein